jgi:hypothetical protein
MRCKICDSSIARPVWNNQLKDWEICPTCLDIVNHVFEDPVVEDAYSEEEDEISLDNPEEIEYNILMDGRR